MEAENDKNNNRAVKLMPQIKFYPFIDTFRNFSGKALSSLVKVEKSIYRGVAMTIADTLKRSDVFLGLDNNDLEIIASLPSIKLTSFQTGQFLFKEGEKAKNLFVIEDGQINVIAEAPNSTENKSNIITIDIVCKGSILGWSALLRPRSYVLSAVCQKPSKVLIIDSNELLALFERNHDIGYRVLQGLSQVIGIRFRYLQQMLITGKRLPFLEPHSFT